jgi:4a-hydroxytetrahydrobiopterin dehydratase
MEDHPDGQSIQDPTGRLPTIWFQETDRHHEPRQRFHLDIRVPPEVAGHRIAAGVAAGGVVIADEVAPLFTVMSDAQGNKVCVCTHVGRDS